MVHLPCGCTGVELLRGGKKLNAHILAFELSQPASIGLPGGVVHRL